MATLKERLSGTGSENTGSGIGYLFNKAVEGLGGALEGAEDFIKSGFAKLFGDDAKAQMYYDFDAMPYGQADYEYNPSKGWRLAGDVAQGIGNSLPMLATGVVGGAAVGGVVGAAGLTGTAANVATGVGNGIVTFTSSFLSAAGSGVKEAYQKSGKLDEKAWKSGIVSGAIEGATETLVDPILGGATSGAVKLGSQIAGNTAKATARAVSSKIGVQIAKDIGSSFISEAVEEGISGILSPIANNLIYREEIEKGEMARETLDWHDIGYQMLVGGLSGAIMGTANVAASNAVALIQGSQAIKTGDSAKILQGAQEILNAYAGDETMVNTEAFKYLQNTLENAQSAKGLMSARYIAELKNAAAQVTLSGQVVSSARNILSNPELVAARINQFGLKDASGKEIKVTAKQIADASRGGNLATALTEEDNILRKLAVLDAAGRLYADTQAYETALEQGKYLGDRADVAHFLQTATTEEVQAVNASLGIDIASASYEDIRGAFIRRAVDGKFRSETQTQSASVSENTAQNAENSSQERVEASEKSANTTEEAKRAEERKAKAKETADANRTLVKSVSQWERLNSRNRTLVRQTYMQAVENGYSQEDALTFARLSAKTGINVEFTEEGMKTANGSTIDGYYDRAENVIVMNPKSKKPFESLLIHELTHSLEGTQKYEKVMRNALNSISESERERIIALYKPVMKGKNAVEKVETLHSEYTAHFTEKALKSKAFLNALLKEDATVKDKIVSFFKQRFGDEKLDRAARKLAKAYEKAFNEMAQANFGANSASASYSEANFGEKQYNLSTYREATILTADGERKSGREILAESLKKAGKTEKEISALLKQIDDVADVVSQLSEEFKTIKDFQGIVPYYRPKADGSGYDPMLRCVVKNGEYELNIDFTTICKKRENLSRFLTEFQESGRSFGKGFTQEAQAYLHNLFQKYDLETACTFCFVESRRVNVNAWSEKITGLWNKALKANGITDAKPISSIEDIGKIDIVNGITDEIAFDVANLIEPAALATMEARATEEYQRFYDNRRTDAEKKVAPNTEERMLEYIKNHAKDGKIFSFDKSDFLNVRAIAYLSAVAPDFYSIMLTAYGANAPKMTLPATPYASDIFYDPSFDKKGIAEKAFGVGGVRINSFSDFQISRILDYVQFIADCEARGLPVQTYTKELAMVEILGKSNIKGNMSLIPEVDNSVDKDHAGLDKSGNYILSRDSVDFEKAIELQEREGIKGYWGTCLVGISKYQILTALDDPRIKMIIPYHRSGMPKALHHYYNHTLYTDYTKFQTTKRADGEKLSNDPFLDVFYKSYRENGGDYFKATEAYLQHCKENNLIPRFAMKWSNARSFEANFNDPANYILNHPNYYKVLIDFTSDGGVDANGKQVFVPQTAVKLDLSGVDVESIVRRDAKLLEQEIGKYEENKGAMFDAFESALNGKKIDAKEQKAIRDARVAEENKTMVFAPQGGRQYSVSGGERYSYENLTKKTPLKVVRLQENVPLKENGQLNRTAILARARANARSQNNPRNTERETFVYVPDLELDVRVGREGIEHGLNRNLDTALATMSVGDLLRSAIAVNELNGRESKAKNTEMSYVLLAVGQNEKSAYLARIIVDKNANTISEISTYGLFALRAIKNGDLFMPNGNEGAGKKPFPYLISDISIAQLFDLVKSEKLANEIFSADVAKNLGVEKSKGKLTDSLRFSISEGEAQPSAGGGTQSSVLSSRTTLPQQSVDARLKKQANRFEIDFVNEFAGIEAFLKANGADANDVESAVQSARGAYSRGQSQIGYGVLDSAEMRKKGGDITIKQPGLQKIFADVRDKGGAYSREFFDYLLHMHNVDRMRLEERSKETLATLEQIRDIMANDKSGTAKEKIDVLKSKIRFFDVAQTLEGVQKQIDNFEIEENKPVFGDNRKEAALLKESIETLNTEVVRLEMIDNKTRKDRRDLKNAQNRLEYLRNVQKNYVVREEAVTAEESEAIAKEYEKKHPEFRAKAEQVWEYSRQINRNRANDGLISQQDVEYYEDKYPHYVPTFRESYTTGISPIRGKNNIAIKQTVSSAEGGGGTIAPLDESLAKQTLAAVRAGAVNRIANMIYDSASRGETDEVEIVSVKKITSSEAYDANYEEETPKANEITFYRDGEKITMRVSREIFAGFDAINGTIDFQNPALTMLQKVMDVFKKSVTTYNPLFVIRNKFRDVQDAGFNTKYGAKFAKMLFSGRAEREIKANSKLWQAFVAAGGMSNTAFDVNEGFQRRVGERGFVEVRNNPAAKLIDMVNIANDFVEQTTRFTEFILSIEAGNSVEQAILDSQEVTTNFGRKGRIAKKFNATISPFLNPSIQGFDKIIRNVKDATKTKQAFLELMFKVALLGIVPQVFNEFIHGFDDDDEYDELSDYVKTNNFLFKVGDVFIRIPKGRLSSAIAGAVVQTFNAAEGRNVDIKGYVENTLSQMSPVENVTRTIFSPVTDVINNRSWSGGTIESQKFENVAPEYRYDERTSSIAIALGKVLKYSPKKIHYLLDQYTGVIGDIILPATSAAAQKDMFSANMTVDAVTSNRLSGDFYDLYDEVNFKKNDPKASEEDRQKASDQSKFLNRVKSAVSDLQQQKTEIQNSNKSKKEKLEETKVVQALINEAYRQAFSEYKDFSTATEKYSDIENADERFAYELRDSVSAEAALKHYNTSVYEKSKHLNTAGISYDNYFDFYFASKNLKADKDRSGNTISGSLRKKVVSEIRKTKLTVDQKLLLLASRGYKPQDGDFSGMTAESAQKRLLAYVRKVTAKMTKEEKEQFAQAFGMTVKNNLIFLQ